MGDAALRLGRELGYVSAGTVEFLVDDDTGEFFFLEVNTRLQVEHPVTEAVTGIDLVREQLRIAQGEVLGYEQADIGFTGHAIEARLYAEDPANDFLPAIGRLEVFRPAAEPPVRWDTGVRTGSRVSVDFDPMIAKVIAHGPTRRDAAGKLALALERLAIGGVVNNRDFLAATLRTPSFLEGDTTTDFIERVEPDRIRAIGEDEMRRWSVVAAMWLQGRNRADAGVLSSLPSGFRVGRLARERATFSQGDRETTVHYTPRREGGFTLGATGDEGTVLVHRWAPGGIDVELDGRRADYAVSCSGDRIHLTGGGRGATLEVVPRFAVPEPEMAGGALTAPMPGKVVELRVEIGDVVAAGQVVAVLEAMKMENHLRAPTGGTVTELLVAPGDQVDRDAALMVIDTGPDEEGP